MVATEAENCGLLSVTLWDSPFFPEGHRKLLQRQQGIIYPPPCLVIVDEIDLHPKSLV